MVSNEDLIAYWTAERIDPDRCFYTGWPLGGAGEVDYLIPPARGGTDIPDNLVPCLAAAKQAKKLCTAGEFRTVLGSADSELGIAV